MKMKKIVSAVLATVLMLGVIVLPTEAASTVTEETLKQYVDIMTGLEFKNGDRVGILPEDSGTSWSTPGIFVHSYAENTIESVAEFDKYQKWASDYIGSGYYEIPFEEYYEYVCSMFSRVIRERMYEYLTDSPIHGTKLYNEQTHMVTVYTGGLGGPAGYEYRGAVKDGKDYVVYMDWIDYLENEVGHKAILTLEGTESGLKIKKYEFVDDYAIADAYQATDSVVGLDNGETWAKITVNAPNATVKFESGQTVEGMSGNWYADYDKDIVLDVTANDGYELIEVTTSLGKIAYDVSANPVIMLEENQFGPLTVTVKTEKINATVAAPVTEEIKKELTEELNTVIADINAGKDVSASVSTETKTAIVQAVEEEKTITVEPVSTTLTTNKVAKEDATEVAKIVTDKGTVAQYLDLKVVVKADGTEIGTLNKLSKPLTFEIEIDKDLIKDGREFYIVRVHDGKAEKIELKHVKDNKYSFESDSFSTYALAYEDAAAAPKTGDTASFVWVMCVVISVGVILAVWNKKRYMR